MNPIYPYYGKWTVCKEQPIAFPPQYQDRQPGLESLMNPRPISENPEITALIQRMLPGHVYMSTVEKWLQADAYHPERNVFNE